MSIFNKKIVAEKNKKLKSFPSNDEILKTDIKSLKKMGYLIKEIKNLRRK